MELRKTLPEWQLALRNTVNSPEELLSLLKLDPELPQLTLGERRRFPLRVPRTFVSRMHVSDPDDPLFLQVWPDIREAEIVPGFTSDAVKELGHCTDGGIMRKYRGRVLLISTGACAVHCRYCFRRHFPYAKAMAKRDLAPTLTKIASDGTVDEVILSGGDPLSLDDERLSLLAKGLELIPHLRRLRIHTRLPVVIPDRVDQPLTTWIRKTRLTVVIVLHVNHAQEIDSSVVAAFGRLRAAGAQLLNQSVLLAGVNDSLDALRALSLRLSAAGVLPYYLHLMDKVQGAAHFEVDERKATALMRALSASMSGYLVPRLVREVAGSPAKVGVRW